VPDPTTPLGRHRIRENQDETHMDFVAAMLDRDAVLDARRAVALDRYGKYVISDITYDEPYPCILSNPETRNYCERNIKTPVTSADALYRQFRKDVISRVCKMLPRVMANKGQKQV
jgi:hypothetical protein